MFVTRGFKGRRQSEDKQKRTPPGQHLTNDFPVLTAGPTQHIQLKDWRFSISGLVNEPREWRYQEMKQLGLQQYTCDIHCVTTWSKLDTKWKGMSIGKLLDQMEVDPTANFALVSSYGGYTTNLPLADLMDDKAFIGFDFDGYPLTAEHGGPARLVVPHLYFWKSAKWVKSIEIRAEDEQGFWEKIGYHDYGDPWLEQRYQGD